MSRRKSYMPEKVCVYLKDDEVIEWVDGQIKEGVFASWSHAVTFALKQLKKRMSSEPF